MDLSSTTLEEGRWSFFRAALFALVIIFTQAHAQEVTVTTSGQNVYVSQQASLTCAFSVTDQVQTVTWYRRVNGVEEVVLTYDNTTSTSTPSGTISSRVEGTMSASSHELRINTTQLEDEGDYYCNVTDVNNNTISNSTSQQVLYYKDGLEVSADGVSSALVRLAPVTLSVVCFLPGSRPAAGYEVELHSVTDNSTTSLTANATATQETDADGVTNTTVTANVSVTTPGDYYVTCRQKYPFMTSASRDASVNLTVADSSDTTTTSIETTSEPLNQTNLTNETTTEPTTLSNETTTEPTTLLTENITTTTAPDSNACLSDPCQNSGTCSNTTSGFTCACPSTHMGDLCQTVVSPCASNPCLNGATCRADVNLTSYECDCTQCYNGTLCDNMINDPCASNPCQSDFTCVVDCPTYACVCQNTTTVCQAVCAVRNPPAASTSVVYGRTTSLTCTPPAAYPVLVTWYKAGVLVSTGNTLTLENVTMEDKGDYMCRVTGSCTSSAQVALSVIHEIQPDKSESMNTSVSAGGTHTLTCNATGQPEPLLYWEYTPKPQAIPDTDTNDTVNGTTDVTTVAPPMTQRLTSPASSPITLTLSDVKSKDGGTYVCRANVMNLTAEDIIIKVIEVTIGDGDVDPKPGCCKPKGGRPPWMLAIIALIVLIIVVVVIVVVILLLKKGKAGEGPFACCFANAVHPEVKDVEKDEKKNGDISPNKYTTSYDDEYEMDKNHGGSYYNHNKRGLMTREEDSWSKARSSEEEEQHRDDDRYIRREERAKTPSPKALNPIGSRARTLPPLDMNSERKKNRKKKKKRSRPEPTEEQEQSGEESPSDGRYYKED